MMLRRTISFCLLAVLSVVAAGCKKRTAKVIPPPPSLPEPSAFLRPLPPLIIELMRPVALPPQPAVAEIPATEPSKKPKPPRRRPRPSNPAQTQPAGPAVPGTGDTAQNNPPRITIDRPQTGEGSNTIAPALDHSDEAHHRQTTAQLLQSTEENLRSITRNLTEDEHATVAQIRNFMAQSRVATTENDLVRAHNLALKAHLLSDELVRH
jgi:hypothetical protein